MVDFINEVSLKDIFKISKLTKIKGNYYECNNKNTNKRNFRGS